MYTTVYTATQLHHPEEVRQETRERPQLSICSIDSVHKKPCIDIKIMYGVYMDS